VITLTAAESLRVCEVRVGDHSEQGLWEVEVDVGVDAEQDVAQRLKGRWCIESQAPRSRDVRCAGELFVKGVEIELGEGHVPVLDPGGILEPPGVDRRLDSHRRPSVGVQEWAQRLVGRPQRVQASLHRYEHFGKRFGVFSAVRHSHIGSFQMSSGPAIIGEAHRRRTTLASTRAGVVWEAG
jgi:hypothetical protein